MVPLSDGPYAVALTSVTLSAGVLPSDGPYEGVRTIYDPPPRPVKLYYI
jgi:hypothetical protein